MAKFALLLPHRPDRYTHTGEEEFMEIIKDYVAWTQEMSEKGIYKGGEKLTDDLGRKLTRNERSIEAVQVSAAELTEVLGGFMIIEAADYEQAVEIARTCPHLVYNETIEVRQIAELDDD